MRKRLFFVLAAAACLFLLVACGTDVNDTPGEIIDTPVIQTAEVNA